MRSFEKLGLEDVTRFELVQFFEHPFRASHFKWSRRLRQTRKCGAERNHYTQESSLLCHDSRGLRYPIFGQLGRQKKACSRWKVRRRCFWRSITPIGFPYLSNSTCPVS